MIRILICSVGSLVGQNLLDALETRRQGLRLIGINSVAANPQNFRCDAAYLAPPTAETMAYEAFLLDLLAREQPDLILSGRDQDTLFLTAFRERFPAFTARIPYASAALAQMSFDKWQTCQFALSQGLAFARTLLARASQPAPLEAFCREVGFPLVAKPLRDSDAAAVRVIRQPAELERLLAVEPELLLQEYLGDPAPLLQALAGLEPAPPLFYQAPDTWHCSCQTVVTGPELVAPVFCSFDRHLQGRTECFEPYADPALAELARNYALAFAAAGGIGPFNVQCRRDRRGRWKALAINLRQGGNTFSRLQCGYDELGLLISTFAPGLDFPVIATAPESRGKVLKTQRNWFVPDRWIEELEQGSWAQN
ncbi:MAG: hypothetical protein ACAI44_38005 [Candidatus Sericytochromatia bacterium]